MVKFSGLLICHGIGISVDAKVEKLTMGILGDNHPCIGMTSRVEDPDGP